MIFSFSSAELSIFVQNPKLMAETKSPELPSFLYYMFALLNMIKNLFNYMILLTNLMTLTIKKANIIEKK